MLGVFNTPLHRLNPENPDSDKKSKNMKKSIFILFLLLFSASITAENDPFVCVHRALIIPQLDFTITLENDTIFYVVEVMPQFPGGNVEMMRFLIEHLRVPSTLYWESGRVFVGFVVEKDGSLTNIEVVRGVKSRI